MRVVGFWLCGIFLILGADSYAQGTPRGTSAVVMLSDLHFDPLRDPGKAERLVAAPVAGWAAILGEPDSAGQAEAFAAVQKACYARGMDSDWVLMRSSLMAARKQAPAARFVTVSGDLVVHGFDCRYQAVMKKDNGYAEFVEKTATFVILQVEAAFAGVPVYFALGNNDSSCGDYRLDVGDRFLKATSAAVMHGLRGAGAGEVARAREQYERDGSYAVTLAGLKGMRLVVIDDIYLSRKYAACSGKAEVVGGAGVLAWFSGELDAARAQNQHVWVMGHVPPGVDVYGTLSKQRDVCGGKEPEMFLGSDALADLLERQGETVRLAVFGHTHMDEFRVFKGVPLKLVASVSPVDGNTPSFTVGQVSGVGELLDYSVYTRAGEGWTREYGFAETYGDGGFSGRKLDAVVGGFRADSAGTNVLSVDYQRDFFGGDGGPLGAAWPQYGCALEHAGAEGFRECLCKATGTP